MNPYLPLSQMPSVCRSKWFASGAVCFGDVTCILRIKQTVQASVAKLSHGYSSLACKMQVSMLRPVNAFTSIIWRKCKVWVARKSHKSSPLAPLSYSSSISLICSECLFARCISNVLDQYTDPSYDVGGTGSTYPSSPLMSFIS